jgi:hypothetical protein
MFEVFNTHQLISTDLVPTKIRLHRLCRSFTISFEICSVEIVTPVLTQNHLIFYFCISCFTMKRTQQSFDDLGGHTGDNDVPRRRSSVVRRKRRQLDFIFQLHALWACITGSVALLYPQARNEKLELFARESQECHSGSRPDSDCCPLWRLDSAFNGIRCEQHASIEQLRFRLNFASRAHCARGQIRHYLAHAIFTPNSHATRSHLQPRAARCMRELRCLRSS